MKRKGIGIKGEENDKKNLDIGMGIGSKLGGNRGKRGREPGSGRNEERIGEPLFPTHTF